MRGGVWKCGTHFTLDHAVSHQVLTEACPPVIHVVCSQLYNWVMAFESLFTLGIRVLQHFPTHCNLLPLTCNPFLLVSLCLRPMRAPFGDFTETPPRLCSWVNCVYKDPLRWCVIESGRCLVLDPCERMVSISRQEHEQPATWERLWWKPLCTHCKSKQSYLSVFPHTSNRQGGTDAGTGAVWSPVNVLKSKYILCEQNLRKNGCFCKEPGADVCVRQTTRWDWRNSSWGWAECAYSAASSSSFTAWKRESLIYLKVLAIISIIINSQSDDATSL